MRKSILLAVAGVVAVAAAAGAWYWFRPDSLVLDRRIEEAPLPGLEDRAAGIMPAALLAVGQFHGVSHNGSGRVTIHRRADGGRVLRLAELEVDNGPDLYVYLIAAPDAWSDGAVDSAEFISLGRLKGNRGNQNYDLPSGVDLDRYRAVSIWCRRFRVNFATAALMMH